MTARDPRKDPKVGDVLLNKSWFNPRRYVRDVVGSIVFYAIRLNAYKLHSCSLDSPKAPGNWHRWAKTAKVIHCAE